MIIGLRAAAFEPWPLLAEAAQAMSVAERDGCGASDAFIGTMRAGAGPRHVERLQLEHYPGMTERMLARIAEGTAGAWPIRQLVLVHRVGEVLPGKRSSWQRSGRHIATRPLRPAGIWWRP